MKRPSSKQSVLCTMSPVVLVQLVPLFTAIARRCFSSSVVILQSSETNQPVPVKPCVGVNSNEGTEHRFWLLIRRLLTSRRWATRCCGCDDLFSQWSGFVCLALIDIGSSHNR
ncbi:hypothetical protein N431DRAFT_239179 [Stipitochalara longipes BDJ]|nr:hypothetical protein N431DRAFT_239179 [Stipitochalara longipes BDJ]